MLVIAAIMTVVFVVNAVVYRTSVVVGIIAVAFIAVGLNVAFGDPDPSPAGMLLFTAYVVVGSFGSSFIRHRRGLPLLAN